MRYFIMVNVTSTDLRKLQIFSDRFIGLKSDEQTKEAERKISSLLNKLDKDVVFTKSFFEELKNLSHIDDDMQDNRNRKNAQVVYNRIYQWCQQNGNDNAINSLEKRGLISGAFTV